MMQIYKILSSDEHNTTYRFIKETFPTVKYTLMDSEGETLYTAEDDEDGIRFEKKIGKNFAYHEIAELHLFLNLIQQFDDTLTDTYDVYQKVTTI